MTALAPGTIAGSSGLHPADRTPRGSRMASAERQREFTRAFLNAARFRRSKIALGFLLAVLFWYSVPYAVPTAVVSTDPHALTDANSAQFEGSVNRQLAVPLLAVCAAFMLWRYPVRGKLGGRLFLTVCLYVGWVLSSMVWSEDPSLTSKRLFVFVLDCFFCYAVARTLTELEMALGAFLATFTVGCLSVFSDIFFLKNFKPNDADYRLQGFMTPNAQGMNLVACALCCAALMVRRPRWAPWLGAMQLVTLAMLWITRARIGTVLCLVLVAVAVYRLIRERCSTEVRATLVLLTLIGVAPMLVFIFGNDAGGAAQSAFMMGRKDTENTSNLSNRLPLWQELMVSVDQRPLLGYGYGAFWTPARAARISKDQGWPVPHAHNLYLDQAIALGYIGSALYLGMMVSALSVAWVRYRHVRSSGNLLNASLLTWLVLLNTSESAPLDPHMPTILVYIAVVRMCLREGSIDTADPDLGDARTGRPSHDRPILESTTPEPLESLEPAESVKPLSTPAFALRTLPGGVAMARNASTAHASDAIQTRASRQGYPASHTPADHTPHHVAPAGKWRTAAIARHFQTHPEALHPAPQRTALRPNRDAKRDTSRAPTSSSQRTSGQSLVPPPIFPPRIAASRTPWRSQ